MWRRFLPFFHGYARNCVFPEGIARKYLVSRAIVPYYYTQLVGDPKNLPTLLAAPTFNDMAVIDANPYIPGGGGSQYWVNQNNFFRVIKNFIIDVRQVPPERPQGTGIHWQVSQATSLRNIIFYMSDAPNTAHQGIWMENGRYVKVEVQITVRGLIDAIPYSGGYMGDLVFNGGKFGMWVGNQQFTVRNITVNNAQTGIFAVWNWGWTFQGLTIRNCQIGIEMQTGGLTAETQSRGWQQTAGAEAIIDAYIVNTPTFLQTTQSSTNSLAGSIVLNNVRLENVPVAVRAANGPILLTGGTRTIESWGQGNVFKGDNPRGQFTQRNLPAARKASSLLDSAGRIVSRPQPQYESFLVSDFVSVKDHGAKGDGVTDDTQALKTIFTQYAGCKIIFFDAGHYIVTDTIFIPAGTRMVGEAWTVLAGRGAKFQNQRDPQVVFQVGKPGDVGVVEISDIIFSTVGPAAGAVIVEWNVKEPSGFKAGAGMWDSHIRTGGVAGSQLTGTECPKSGAGGYDNCFAAFLHLHITKQASAYLEISVYSGRGILSESQGPVWLIGTGSEHHVIYQYRLLGAKDHYMGLIQTESPYYQPTPPAPAPFSLNESSKYFDPALYNESAPSAWALSIQTSTDIFIFGAGLYSFFQTYFDCASTRACQSQSANIDRASSVYLFSLSSVGTTKQLSIEGQGIVDQGDNINGFASTVTYWGF
ncbi:hypothetical protein MD484_g4242, partial [Candolleomyces efflorescens]